MAAIDFSDSDTYMPEQSKNQSYYRLLVFHITYRNRNAENCFLAISGNVGALGNWDPKQKALCYPVRYQKYRFMSPAITIPKHLKVLYYQIFFRQPLTQKEDMLEPVQHECATRCLRVPKYSSIIYHVFGTSRITDIKHLTSNGLYKCFMMIRNDSTYQYKFTQEWNVISEDDAKGYEEYKQLQESQNSELLEYWKSKHLKTFFNYLSNTFYKIILTLPQKPDNSLTNSIKIKKDIKMTIVFLT